MLKDKMLPPSIKKSLLFIEKMFLNCKSERGLTKRYLFKDNLKINEMIPYLEKIKYTIQKQVVNYNYQVIGLMVINHNKEEGFLPIKPSTINNKMENVMMDDSSIWKDYNQTLKFLKDIYMLSKKKIPCLPKFKVEEDGLIVGFLTMTNQFVMIDPPQENIPDEIEVIKGYNYIQLDKIFAQSEKKDVDREIITKKIKLESHFFNIFRNTVRILLQEYKYKKVRDLIEETIETSIEYDKKLEIIMELLRKMLEKHVDFVKFSTKVLKNIDMITSCLKLNKANCKEKSYCLGDNSKYCKLLIPDKHLISEHDNRVIYFGRMADELVRYGRIRRFMFDPQQYINFQTVQYNLDITEIILFDHLLVEGYFDDLIVSTKNPYIVHKKTLLTAGLIKDDRTISINKKIDEKCLSKKYVKGNEWKKIFKKYF